MKKLFAMGLALALFTLSACEDDNEVQLDQPSMKIKVAIKMQVGGILYENINPEVVVEGVNSLEEAFWVKEYDYTHSAENVFDIPTSSQLYRISFSQWGKTFKSLFTLTELMNARVDGPQPSTIILNGSITPKKLKAYTRFMDKTVNGEIQRLPILQEQYEYQAGKLSRITSYEYNDETQSFDLKRYFTAEHAAHGISKLKGYLAETDEQFDEMIYTYLNDGRLAEIKVNNLPENLTNKATFTYNSERPGYVAVTYQSFNGNSFTYSFDYTGGNIISEEIHKGGQLCSSGSRTYDSQINPFKHTGYTDFLLNNFSINNQVDEDIQFKACAFPDLTIVSQSYIYMDSGYPFTKEITYSNGMKSDERYSYYQD